MIFPLHFLKQLRDRIDLVDLIRRDVNLVQHNSEWLGLCPFHIEKTPSFHVVPEKKFYHCFGCGAHGDGLKFLRNFHQISFQEAIKILANIAGLNLPHQNNKDTNQKYVSDINKQIMIRITELFQQHLYDSQEGYIARKYLNARGIDKSLCDRFNLGYAVSDHVSMLNQLGISINTAKSLGLLRCGDHGNYAFFRHRLMFPIKDEQGHTIAFGGRRLCNDHSAKYINSPDTALFRKRDTLYNLHKAKIACYNGAPTLIVVEGYIDVITMYSAGFSTVVASLGTSLTISQLQTLWQLCAAPIICLDGDYAGQKAAAQIARLALCYINAGYNIRFAFLPEGKDPDSIIRAHGTQTMQIIVDQAIGLGEFLWHLHANHCDWTQPEEISILRQKLADLEKNIKDPHIRISYRQYWCDCLWQTRKHKSSKNIKTSSSNTTNKITSKTSNTSIKSFISLNNTNYIKSYSFQIILATFINHPTLIAEFIEQFTEVNFTPHLDKIWQELQIYISKHKECEINRDKLLLWLQQKHSIRLILNQTIYQLAPEAKPDSSEQDARRILLRLIRLLYEKRLMIDIRQRLMQANEDKASYDQLHQLRYEIISLRKLIRDSS